MATIILSGVGGSTNWLPLVFPLVAILALLFGAEYAVRFIKKWRLHRTNRLINHHTSQDHLQQPDNPE